jgi:phosphatidylglycerophosphatase A
VPLAWAASWLPLWGQLALALAVTLFGTVAAKHAGRYWGVTDASPIVIDEVAGYLVTMLGIPFTWPAALLGFLLFRTFDVVKPWPASYFDRQHSAASVMLDDVAAGVWALAVLHIISAVLVRARGCAGAPFYCGM